MDISVYLSTYVNPFLPWIILVAVPWTSSLSLSLSLSDFPIFNVRVTHRVGSRGTTEARKRGADRDGQHFVSKATILTEHSLGPPSSRTPWSQICRAGNCSWGGFESLLEGGLPRFKPQLHHKLNVCVSSDKLFINHSTPHFPHLKRTIIHLTSQSCCENSMK